MMDSDRRDFLKAVAACGLAATTLRSEAPAAHIEILPAEPIATIAPEIYGHFIEHLGGVIYDGVWVGPDSKIPNEGGIRRAVIDALKAIHAPVIRWPGGCFADSYDWRDGIGTEASRKARTNFWGGTDPNAFGTQEFMRFCDLAGTKPYLAANVRGLGAHEFNLWVEYCNSAAGSTEGARQRAAQGHPEPYDVRYWGVGNESWGCGGNFTPEEYAAEFRRFTAWVPRYGKPVDLIASGPNDHELEWTRRLLHALAEKDQIRSAAGLSLHYYTWNVSAGRTTDWNRGKGDALNFTELEWYELLSQGSVMDTLIRDHWAVMGESDPQHHIRLIVDEWGAWYRSGTEIEPASKYIISQMLTLRDGLLTGLTLDIFHRHAEKVAMANAAQLINCLHSLMLAREDQFVLTPVYHVFKMYMPHMGAQAVRTEFAAPPVGYERNGATGSLWGLAGSASLSGRNLTLTTVNPHPSRAVETEIVVRGASISGGRGQVITSSDLHAHNDFAHPHALEPQPVSVTATNGRLVYRFAPASVTALYLTLA